MNWKRALFVTVLLSILVVLLAVACVGATVVSAVASVVDSTEVDTLFDAMGDAFEESERVEIDINLPRVTVTDLDSGRKRIVELDVPQITITDPETGVSEIVVPDLPSRGPRIRFERPDFDYQWHVRTWNPFSFIGGAMRFLFAITLVGLGAYILLKKRPPVEKNKIDAV